MHNIPDWPAFQKLLNGREVYIYGGNVEGVGVSRMISSHYRPTRGFIDTRQFNHGFLRSVPVVHPAAFSDSPAAAFIVICTKHRETRALAKKFCLERGYVEGRDFVFNSALCRYFPTIETVGICNLRCITCDMGIPGANHNQKMMRLETFSAILDKLKAEIPFLNSLALYLWGEPLLHPEVGEMVRACHARGIATEFSSNLNNIRHLDSFIAADPDILIVTSSGFGDNYEITHTGGDFEKFRNNCIELRQMIDKHGAETFVKYHYCVYNNNQGEEMLAARRFAESLNFQFVPILANIFPGKVHDYVVLGTPLPDVMLEANKYLLYDIHDQIQWAQAQRDKHCPVIKAFPTIRWDGRVMQCCNMTQPFVGDTTYLETSMSELLELRESSGFCQRCMAHGMHRVFDVNGREDKRMTTIAIASSKNDSPKA